MPDAVATAPVSLDLAFIGGGNMARSLIGGLLARGVPAAQIQVSEPQQALRDALAADFGVMAGSDNATAAARAQLVLLAVKPQAMRAVCEGLAGAVDGAIVVSIAAGITCDQIRTWTQHAGAIVRCMPNTPALLGAGATGMYANGSTSAAQRDATEAVLAAVGRCVWVEDEALMDSVTALSGSGPAYVFLLAEALQQAAVAQGLPADAANALTRQTLLGAARMLDEAGEPAQVLRQRVTSPGGTTQAAIESFLHDDFHAIVARALDAARDRGLALSRQTGG